VAFDGAVLVATVLAAVGGLTSAFARQASAIALTATRSERQDSPKEIRLLFTGDVLLSRQVAAEIRQKRQSPWINLGNLFHSADWVGGNLEGAVGSSLDCRGASERSPCFAIDASMLPLARSAGFTALGNENNHAGDLGAVGRESTRQALAAAELLPLTFEASPAFLRFGELTIAVVSVTTVPDRAGNPLELPSVVLEQKLRLAHALANLVVVSIHWGSELIDWPTEQQRQQADWLIAHGADAIFGSHPHVAQHAGCVAGKPVFFSLGNHVFDQKYPATKEGLIADCRLREGSFSCAALRTHTMSGSSFPEAARADPDADQALAACPVPIHPTLNVAGYMLRPQPSSPQDNSGKIWIEGFAGPQSSERAWRTRPTPVLSLEAGNLEGPARPQFLLSLERHASPIDSERDPRPYVYEVGPQGFIARWRGSALAWPLLDARLLPEHAGVLCALHRRDSFLMLSPESKGTRVAAYRWNGFGFEGITDEGIVSGCRALFGEKESVAPSLSPESLNRFAPRDATNCDRRPPI
jgi:poly-gamma-glutamate synthesis protein (capsule biosynthesis protein)